MSASPLKPVARDRGSRAPAAASPRPTPPSPGPGRPPAPDASNLPWPTAEVATRCVIRDTDGHRLVRARVHLTVDLTTVVIEKVADPAVLLRYYFLSGARRVDVGLGPRINTGLAGASGAGQ